MKPVPKFLQPLLDDGVGVAIEWQLETIRRLDDYRLTVQARLFCTVEQARKGIGVEAVVGMGRNDHDAVVVNVRLLSISVQDGNVIGAFEMTGRGTVYLDLPKDP